MPLTADPAVPPSPARPARRDALSVWAPFALPPLRLEVPLVWHPQVANWTRNSAHVRWETLTGTPLEINWMWIESQGLEPPEYVRKRLDQAWTKEIKAAEEQAKKTGLALKWKGPGGSLANYARTEAAGTVREYAWNGQPGCMAVLSLAGAGKRIFAAASICPSASCDQPEAAIKRVLRSIKLDGKDDPLRIGLGAFSAELPGSLKLRSVRGREGQQYFEAEDLTHKVGLARLGFAELHEAQGGREKVWSSLVKLLFDRGEVSHPVATTFTQPKLFGPSVERAPDEADTMAAVQEHEAGLFREKRRFHIRFGDAVLRRLGRSWSGGAAALAWSCPKTHSVWAVSLRCGERDSEKEIRELAKGLVCHGRPAQEEVDWRPYVLAEAKLSAAPDAKSSRKANKKKGKKQLRKEQEQSQKKAEEGDAKKTSPVEMRRRQLCFRVRTRPEVSLEVSSKDGSGCLTYEAQGGAGLLASVLRGGQPPQTFYRRLNLDPVGRRTWELMAQGSTVAELLAVMSAELGVHPVEFFAKLLTFLKMIGERRLVEGVPEDVEENPSEEAAEKRAEAAPEKV